MKKRILLLALLFTFITQNVYASILGSVVTTWSHDIANGTLLYNNVFLSTQSGVGKQTEYYAEYTPNPDILPIVVNGSSLWGTRTIKEAEKYMKDMGMTPMLGINASYFSFKTGIPMGHVISDGNVISKDTQSYPSIGFNADGSAFISPLAINARLFYDETEIDIAHINKYNQPEIDVLNLYTEEFADNNHSNEASLNIILGEVSGGLKIGSRLTAIVEEKFNYAGAIKIPEGKLVLTLNEGAKAEIYEKLSLLEIGTEVEISLSANDERWNEVQSGLGSEGEQLISNGEVRTDYEAGAAPRTAVGITESGNLIFYVIDGRQTGYSYGVQKKTLAKRLKEMGCTDAINLDGGGSTAISGIYPGSGENSVLNSPSGGALRSCTNYIFLQNMQKPTGMLNKLYLYPFQQHYLSGYSEEIYPAAVDTAYYKTDLPEDIEYSISGTKSTVENGILTAQGTGKFTITASGGGAEGSADYYSYSSPTNINVYNNETNKEIKSLKLKENDKIKLNLTAQHYYIDLKVSDNCFDFEVTDNLGYVNEENELIITSKGGNGTLKVIAGEYVKEIPISVEFQSIFNDIHNHWARDMINEVYEREIISGYQTENGFEFKPDNNMTREEFAVVMCRFLDIDTNEFADIELSFADEKLISNWAKNSVAAMYKYGIITGKTNGEIVNFAPADTLTRAEAITILGRVIGGETDTELTFSDAKDIPDWSLSQFKLMLSKGFVSGYDDNTIKPNGKVTRAEAVTMLYKIINTSF